MASVARSMVEKPKPKNGGGNLNRRVAAIGRAPRTIVCFACASTSEIVLGRIDSDKMCDRCRKPLKRGVVVQAPAASRRKDVR